MVSLKPIFIITAVLIKTLIVLTFTDLVFSEDNEKERCIIYIEELYKTKNPFEIFRKGFYQFNKAKIEEINARIVSEKNDNNQWILEKMNYYTYRYFLEVLKTVYIPGKHYIFTQTGHCEELYGTSENEYLNIIAFQGMDNMENEQLYDELYYRTIEKVDRKVDECIDFLSRKYRLSIYVYGDEVFNTLYTYWTDDEVRALQTDVPNDSFEYVNDDIYDTILSFYGRYEKALNLAEVSGMITPNDYCGRITSESTNTTEELEPTDET